VWPSGLLTTTARNEESSRDDSRRIMTLDPVLEHGFYGMEGT